MRRTSAVIAMGCAMLAIAAAAQERPRGERPRGDPAEEARNAASRKAFYRTADTGGSGPYPSDYAVDPRLPTHTVYAPRDLSALGDRKLGVLVWGNGGCREDGASARAHLNEIASHGYVAIAPGTILSGPKVAVQPTEERRALGVKTTTQQVLAGIDWILAENARPGSRFFGRVDPRQVAVSGTSCGGLQAIQAAADPRVRAVIVHNSGVFADGSNPITGMTVDKSLLTRFHTPVLYVLGGKGDVAYVNGADDVRRIEHVPVVLADIDVGHSGTFREPNGGAVAPVAVAWLAWQLRGDRTAARMFTGAECGLCRDPKWTVTRKRIG